MTWQPPPQLDQDMRASDLINALRDLKFRGDEFQVVWLDQQVRDFLIDSLSTRQHVSQRD